MEQRKKRKERKKERQKERKTERERYRERGVKVNLVAKVMPSACLRLQCNSRVKCVPDWFQQRNVVRMLPREGISRCLCGHILFALVGTCWNGNHHWQEAKHFQSASKILIILQAQGQTGLQDPKNVYYYILLVIIDITIYILYIYIYGVWCPLQMFAALGTLACEARAELVAAQYAGSSAAKHWRAPDVIWCNNIIWRNYIRSPGARW